MTTPSQVPGQEPKPAPMPLVSAGHGRIARPDHGWLDVGDGADGDGLGAADPMDCDGVGVGEIDDVGERFGCGV